MQKIIKIVILLRIYNTTAITYLNRMGDTFSSELNNITKEIWKWCEKRSIRIFASYRSSKNNIIADSESRQNQNYHIKRSVVCYQYSGSQ